MMKITSAMKFSDILSGGVLGVGVGVGVGVGSFTSVRQKHSIIIIKRV